MNQQEKRMPLWERFSYGMGNFGGNTGMMLVTSFFMYYCTDSLKLSSGVIGALLIISKTLDGLSDILMGHIINLTRSKLGKSRFWLILCAIPYGIVVALLFYVPTAIPKDLSYIYLFVIYLLYSAVFYTMFSISSTSLVALATKNEQDRYSMSMFYYALGGIPIIIMGFIVTPIVEWLGGGRRAWAIVALVIGTISALTILWSGLVVKELPEENDLSGRPKEKVKFTESVKSLAGNKYFWYLLIINLAIYIYYGMQGAVGIYYCNHILHDESMFGWINLAIYAPMAFLLYFVEPVVNRFGIRRCNVIGGIFAVCGGLIAFIDPNSAVLVCVACLLGNIGISPQYITMNPLIAEAAEYGQRKTGKDVTTMLFSAVSVGMKVGTGIGTALVGVMLDFSGYDPEIAVQSAGALNAITLMFLLAPVIGYVLMAFFFWKTDVDEVNRRER